MDDCIFCMIGKGEMAAQVVYEDEKVIAFDDIEPQAPVHTLIIPKDHYVTMNDALPDDVLIALFAAVPKVAKLKGVLETGYRVIINNGQDANQAVAHLHVHIFGGRAMSHGMVNFPKE